MDVVSPSRVAVVSPLDVVAAGLTAMLGQYPEQVEVVELATGVEAVDPDVIIYDAIGLHEGDGADLEFYVKETSASVLVVSQDLRPDLASRALARGADGFFSLGVDDEELLTVVRTAVSSASDDTDSSETTDVAVEHRLGQDVGLTPREVDVLSLITQGLSNQEIAEQSYLSINSVKTYIRSAYRRIGVTSRSQAVVWCLQHGFAATPED